MSSADSSSSSGIVLAFTPASLAPEIPVTPISYVEDHSEYFADVSVFPVWLIPSDDEPLPDHAAIYTISSETPKLKLTSTVTLAKSVVCDAPIAIRCEVTNEANRTPIRYASVEFHREGRNAAGVLRSTHGASSHKSQIWRNDQYLTVKCIRFSFENALVFGVGNVPEEWPEEFKAHFKSLTNFHDDGTVSLELPSTHISDVAIGRLESSLNKNTPPELWKPFKRSDGKMHTSWSALEDNYKVKSDKGQEYKNSHVEYPTSYCYVSPEEACVKLTHGVYAEYLWEQQEADNICHGSFRARFYQTYSDLILVEIERGGRTETKLRTALDDNMLIEVRVLNRVVENGSLLGAGKVTTNLPFALSPVLDKYKFVLLFYRHSTTKLARKQAYPAGKGGRQDSKEVTLTIKDYESSKIQIDSINTFFDRSSDVFQKWWPGFLGSPSRGYVSSNWLKDDLGVSQQTIDVVVAKAARLASASSMTLNEEQMSILSDIGNSYGGWSLWRGPPGTGKTTTIALMIYQLLQFEGVGVYACSPSNGSVNRLSSCIFSLMARTDVKDLARWPLRIYRKYNELRYLKSVTHPYTKSDADDDSDEDGNLSPPETYSNEADDIVLDEWCKLQQEAEEKRLMDEPKNGLMGAVIQAIRSGILLEADAARSSEEPRDAKERLQKAQFCKAHESLGPLQAHLSGEQRMAAGDGFDQHIKHVRDQILGARRLIVSTVGNAKNLLIRDSIFRDCKKVVIVVDEQSLDTDAGTLNLLAGLVDIRRVMGEFGGESPIVQLIMVGDEAQGSPLIRSLQEGVNPFGDQLKMSLFARMLVLGHPVKTLLEQHRMAPIIRTLPSERCYGGKLRDSLQVQQRDFDATFGAKGRRYLHGFMKNYSKETFEQDCRHLLADVPDSFCEIERETRSKVNPKNLAVTILLIKHLIVREIVAPQDIVILVMYHGQKRAYERALMDLERSMRCLKVGDLFGGVQTSDSFQGRERKCVILDLVETRAYYLGNLGNEKRMNVACSRARELFFVVGSLKLLFSNSGSNPPYVIELLQRLKDRDALINLDKLNK